MDQDITHLVERLEVIEDKVGIRLEGIYAWISGPDSDGDYRLEVNGEAQSLVGTSVDEVVNLIAELYI